MKTVDRVAELLESVLAEERLRGRTVDEAARLLGLSVPMVYRLVAEDHIGYVKTEGRTRKGEDGKDRGRAGSVRIRLIDIAEYQARNEHVSGKGPRALPDEKSAAKAAPLVAIEPAVNASLSRTATAVHPTNTRAGGSP